VKARKNEDFEMSVQRFIPSKSHLRYTT